MNSGLYQFADNVIHTSDKDLGAETVAAVVITGLAVVFIGLILLIALVWLYGKIFQVVNDKAAKKAAAAAAAGIRQRGRRGGLYAPAAFGKREQARALPPHAAGVGQAAFTVA